MNRASGGTRVTHLCESLDRADGLVYLAQRRHVPLERIHGGTIAPAEAAHSCSWCPGSTAALHDVGVKPASRLCGGGSGKNEAPARGRETDEQHPTRRCWWERDDEGFVLWEEKSQQQQSRDDCDGDGLESGELIHYQYRDGLEWLSGRWSGSAGCFQFWSRPRSRPLKTKKF